jgi:hypothetical protein
MSGLFQRLTAAPSTEQRIIPRGVSRYEQTHQPEGSVEPFSVERTQGDGQEQERSSTAPNHPVRRSSMPSVPRASAQRRDRITTDTTARPSWETIRAPEAARAEEQAATGRKQRTSANFRKGDHVDHGFLDESAERNAARSTTKEVRLPLGHPTTALIALDTTGHDEPLAHEETADAGKAVRLRPSSVYQPNDGAPSMNRAMPAEPPVNTIELVAPPRAPQAQRAPAFRPAMSLDDYLQRRNKTP